MPISSFFQRFIRTTATLALALISITATAQSTPGNTTKTHHYDLRDAALARAAQRYDWAQEGKGNRAVLEELVADDYTLVRGSGKTTDKAGLIGMICSPTGYTNPYVVEAPIVKDMGDTFILGGFVRITGKDSGKPFEQKARFADIWHKDAKGWRLHFTQVTLADHP